MTFYEKLVEAAHGVGDTACQNPDTNEVTAVGGEFCRTVWGLFDFNQ